VMQDFAQPGTLIDSFLCLAAVGVLLGLVRALTGNIAACVGLHAGWVAVIFVTREVSRPDPGSPARWLMGAYDGVIGWMVLAWIPVIGWILISGYRRRNRLSLPAAPG